MGWNCCLWPGRRDHKHIFTVGGRLLAANRAAHITCFAYFPLTCLSLHLTVVNYNTRERSRNYEPWATCCETRCHRANVAAMKTDGSSWASLAVFSLFRRFLYRASSLSTCTFTARKPVNFKDGLHSSPEWMSLRLHFKCNIKAELYLSLLTDGQEPPIMLKLVNRSNLVHGNLNN